MADKKIMRLTEIMNYLSRVWSNSKTTLVYSVLLLYYAYQNDDTPGWAKRIVLGSVTYVLSPIDAIPDLSPLIGMTDDIGVLGFGITSIACYIDKEVRSKAKDKIHQILGEEIEDSLLVEVDKRL